jgi:SNF2 family DNA or RNA helicase
MLVSKKHQKLLLNLNNPERVLEIMPQAKLVNFKGRDLVAVPHRLDEVRVLRNIGIDAPGPMKYHYDWPGLYRPYDHQFVTADFLVLNPRAFCLNDMGTGKTISVLWAYDFLRRWDYAQGALLVVGPLSTLERTWADEVFRHFPHLNVAVLHGSASRRMKLLEAGADVFVINHDGIKSKEMQAALAERVKDGRISVVVPDELSAFRNQSTERWKSLQKITREAQYVWGLTGTPIPSEPTDAYGQVKLINPGNVPKYFNAFRDAVMRQITQFKWVAREGALDHVYSVMQPAVRFSRADCIDLPPTTYQMAEAPMTDDQQRVYNDMLGRMRAEFQGGQITALNEAVMVGKLLQIACGAAYTADGDDVIVPAEARIRLVLELIEQSRGKVIVFVPFRGALAYLGERLRKEWGEEGVAEIHGGVSKNERDQIFADFQRREYPRVLLAQPATMSHGLTLTAANTMIWFAPINSAETYQQACARIVRPGQKLNTLIVHVEGSAVERKMYDRLQRRTTTQGVLLEMFKDR